jgi:hypothetical protein
MIPLSASVNRIMLVIHCKVVDANVNRPEIVHLLKNVNDLSANLSVEKEYAERVQTVKHETIVPNVLVLPIFLAMGIPDVTQNVPNMTIAHEIRLA